MAPESVEVKASASGRWPRTDPRAWLTIPTTVGHDHDSAAACGVVGFTSKALFCWDMGLLQATFSQFRRALRLLSNALTSPLLIDLGQAWICSQLGTSRASIPTTLRPYMMLVVAEQLLDSSP